MSDSSSPESKPLSVVLVDDSKVVLRRLEELISQVDGVEVVGTASDGASAIRIIGDVSPDLAIMDIVMPGMDGMAALRVIHANFSRTRVAMLSSLAGAASKAEEAFRLGAVQVISKPFEPAVLEALFESEREHRRAEGGA